LRYIVMLVVLSHDFVGLGGCRPTLIQPLTVIPAKAGIHLDLGV
jgi:hypothetical protein